MTKTIKNQEQTTTFPAKTIPLNTSEFVLAFLPFAKKLKGSPVDFHALAVLLDKDGSAVGLVYWDNETCQGFTHNLDDNEFNDAAEEIRVNTSEISADVARVAFVFTTESSFSPGHTLKSLQAVALQLFTEENQEEVAVLSEAELGTEAFLEAIELARTTDGSWCLNICPTPISGGFDGFGERYQIDCGD